MNQAPLIEKLYNQILHELQALYAVIAVDRLSYDCKGYSASIKKLVAVGEVLGLETVGGASYE